MINIKPEHAIIPIVRCTEAPDIKELLGTGFIVGQGDKIYVVTAKHVFESSPLEEGEKYGYLFKGAKGIQLYRIQKIIGVENYDIAVFEATHIPEAVSLAFSEQQPANNEDVYCNEYSSTRIEKKETGGKHVSIVPMIHKGNIMRFYDSEFPENKKTPCFIVSFPALQGASGAPVLAITKNKNLYVAGMIVENWQRYLLPAQIVKIQDGKEYIEETSYFLPLGKAINASLIAQVLKGLKIDLQVVE